MEANEALISILEMLKQQAVYLHRQHGWLIAVAETVKQNPEMAKHLEQHPFYDQGPRLDIQTTRAMIQNTDALIQQLKNVG